MGDAVDAIGAAPGGPGSRISNADQVCKRSFGSNHASGQNFGLADGSVRFIPSSIDTTALSYMATMMGGEVVTSQ